MEPIYKEDETKRIIEELHDPLLRVEFNPRSMEWEVLKLATDKDFMVIPGYVVGLNSEFINLSYPIEYWSTQATFKYWGQHVFDAMRKGRAGYRETKEILNDIDVHDDHIRAKQQEYMDDVREKTIKTIEKGKIVYSTPGIYFKTKAS
jgi:hypothetical protein